jgi:hypothetical protein
MDEAREFEWDAVKRRANIDKHRLDFEDIGPAFDDENALHVPDRRFDYGEERVMMIPRCNSVILSIVYTMRGERTRIISARFANQRERAIYERG